jgi:hypothetical protein
MDGTMITAQSILISNEKPTTAEQAADALTQQQRSHQGIIGLSGVTQKQELNQASSLNGALLQPSFPSTTSSRTKAGKHEFLVKEAAWKPNCLAPLPLLKALIPVAPECDARTNKVIKTSSMFWRTMAL